MRKLLFRSPDDNGKYHGTRGRPSTALRRTLELESLGVTFLLVN